MTQGSAGEGGAGREAAGGASLLAKAPAEADVSLLIRHAERHAIPPGSFGTEVPLTPAGVSAAEGLGERLASERRPGRLVSSPVARCVATGEAIGRGAGGRAAVATDRRLGDPGPFIANPEEAGALLMRVGLRGLAQRQLEATEEGDGLRPAAEGVAALLELTAGNLGDGGRLEVYITHDVILAVLTAHLCGGGIDEAGWPDYLDGLLMWRQNGGLWVARTGLEQGAYPVGG